tara:strand:+ start:5107 stop:5493 length:387 start_codon:yes stop_codon:yes gene_type:complete
MNYYEEKPYKIIANDKGNIYKFAGSDEFPDFIKGDVYFSEINPYSSKPWRRHTELTCVLGVVYGETIIKIKPRIDSQYVSTNLFLGNKKLVKIKPGNWYCFENEKDTTCLLFAMLNGRHEESEVERLL